jgi:hypothetical protein
MVLRLTLTAPLCLSSLGAAGATPARIIILRHGEKADAWNLCEIGQDRANALATYYLGRNAAKSLFAPDDKPAAFFAITLHTQELAAPAATTWGEPLTVYSVIHRKGLKQKAFETELDHRTQQAVHDVMTDSRFSGKTVVIVWEHKHIANKKLKGDMSGEGVTLRQLLKLDQLPGVPENWPSGMYDYFWIVEYGNQDAGIPTRFSMIKQEFEAPYDGIPNNDWGQPNRLGADSGCDLKGAED